MLNTNKRGRLFTRRALILASMKSGLLLSLVARLYYLQVVKSDEYTTFAESNRARLVLLPPERGKILDRNGQYFATNKNYYRILFDPQVEADKEVVIGRLISLLKLSDEDGNKMRKIVKQNNSLNPFAIYEHLTWNEVAKVEVNSPDLPGVSIDLGQIRHFTMGEVCPQTIGYLGPVSEEEIKKNKLLNHPDFKVGRSGIEKVFEQDLRGKVGIRRMEVNAYGFAVRELSREQSVPGKDIKLTLDLRLQEFVGKRLADNGGSAVVIDLANGELLALASSPGFDPEQFTYGVSPKYWNQLINDPEKPLINKAISNQYPPGSTFKLVVALAAQKEGVSPDMEVFCPGYLDLGKRRFHCWKKGGHGNVNMREAIMHSCNTYFYTIAKKIGVDSIVDMAKNFNLGDETGLILPNEKRGLLPSREWKEKNFSEVWQMGDTLNLGIGQGYTLATPLQMAIMVARVATGRYVTPRITELTDPDIINYGFDILGIPEKHLEVVRDGMYRVVNVPGGTAFASKIANPNFSMAGKTGTSQVISKKNMKTMDIDEEDKKWARNHAIFVGFGPVEKPRYAAAVVIEHGGGGAAAAAPVARDILEKVQELNSA